MKKHYLATVIIFFYLCINVQPAKANLSVQRKTKMQLITATPELPTSAAILNYMKKVADWQLANPTGKPLNVWEYGPFYHGIMKLYHISNDNALR